MIHIEKDQEIPENQNLRVATATGDYEDSALIEFYDIAEPAAVIGSFQAQYVRYGSLTYRFNSHQELGSAILKIDPTSTHTAASYVRMTEELLVQMNGGSLEPTSLDDALSVEQAMMEESISAPKESAADEADIIPAAASGTPTADPSPAATSTPVTTDPLVSPDANATSTDAVPEIVPTVAGAATSTVPEMEPETPVELTEIPAEPEVPVPVEPVSPVEVPTPEPVPATESPQIVSHLFRKKDKRKTA